jgi:hypothetical protein
MNPQYCVSNVTIELLTHVDYHFFSARSVSILIGINMHILKIKRSCKYKVAEGRFAEFGWNDDCDSMMIDAIYETGRDTK